MHVSTKRRGLKALGLAVALVMALAPVTALAGDRTPGTFSDTVVVTGVARDGSETRRECTILNDDAIMPLEGGWWLLEDETVPKDKVIEVTGDVHFVCGPRVDLVTGHVHVAFGAHLDLYYEKGHENDAVLSASHGYNAIVNEGVIGECAIPVSIEDRGPLSYLDVDGVSQVKARADFVADLSCGGGLGAGLAKGWYYVSKDCTFSERIDLKGDVTIVVCNGAKLTCEKGIHVAKDKSLTLLGQEGRGGRVVAHPGYDGSFALPGIGCNEYETDGTITICDVSVRAEGDARAPGISCGDEGKLTIRRANVDAVGGYLGAAIGAPGGENRGDNRSKGGTIIIEDSKVSALCMGTSESAGIGGTIVKPLLPPLERGGGGDVTILGDSVVDANSASGAAIGRAEGAKDPGKVHLSDNLRVIDLDNGGVIAPSTCAASTASTATTSAWSLARVSRYYVGIQVSVRAPGTSPGRALSCRDLTFGFPVSAIPVALTTRRGAVGSKRAGRGLSGAFRGHSSHTAGSRWVDTGTRWSLRRPSMAILPTRQVAVGSNQPVTGSPGAFPGHSDHTAGNRLVKAVRSGFPRGPCMAILTKQHGAVGSMWPRTGSPRAARGHSSHTAGSCWVKPASDGASGGHPWPFLPYSGASHGHGAWSG